MAFSPGDILITRNKPGNNDSPGYWNHTSLYVGQEIIVEAQGEPYNCVKETNLNTFINFYPEILVLRTDSEYIANKASIFARAMVGTEYWRLSSIFRHLRRNSRGTNCVGLVRRAYKDALEYDPLWHIPDDIANDGIFKTVSRKPDIR